MFNLNIDWVSIWNLYGTYIMVGVLIIIILIKTYLSRKKGGVKMMDKRMEARAFMARLKEIERSVQGIRQEEMEAQQNLYSEYRNKEKLLTEEWQYLKQRIDELNKN